ncbi:hypothetical protein [Streptomyces sp. NPDC093094]|uniref:hypothetical protein n=1 Tax=Streptomyces sp. NPDC093094 TaxID=3366026 RepID=UPI003817FA9B
MQPPTQGIAPSAFRNATEHAPQPHRSVATAALRPEPEAFRFRWSSKLLANEASGPNARLRVRPRLTAVCWAGNIDAAGQISDQLVDNAARHGTPFHDGCIGVRLTVLPDTDELHIEVDDADPAFPDFRTISCAPSRGSGLWWVQHYGARLSWEQTLDADGYVTGKTVTAVLRPVDEGDWS